MDRPLQLPGEQAHREALVRGYATGRSTITLRARAHVEEFAKNRSRIVGAITGAGTVPQVFINGERIGGLEELERWAKKAA